MKFAEKMIWSCLLTVVIVFSMGASFMLLKNHQHLLRTMVQQNISSHDIELYNLETRLLQDQQSFSSNFGNDHNYMQDRAIYYLEQLQNLSSKQTTYVLSQKGKIIFSNMNTSYDDLIKFENKDHYYFRTYDHHHLMFMTTSLQIGNEDYDLTACYNMDECYEERDRQIHSFLVISLFIFILALIILKMISKYMTASILKLNETSQRIAKGEYSERTHIESEDEIGELSRSFDMMATMNEQTIEELKRSVIQKEEFMGSFSHEIKTPMTAILGFADLLRTCDCDEFTRQKAAQYIYTEAKRLEKLSYALMDLLAMGDHQIQLQRVSLKYIFHQLKNYYQNDSYIFDFDEIDIDVKSQSDLLFVLLRNLIDNAKKASQQGQSIYIKVKHVETKVQIAVIDEGIGMSEEDARKATEAFYMADKSRSRSQGGAGLGLAIVKRICDLHQTSLVIDSKLHEGTRVSFELEVFHE